MEELASESQGSLSCKEWDPKQGGKELVKSAAHSKLRKKLNKLVNNLSHPAVKRGHFKKLRIVICIELHAGLLHLDNLESQRKEAQA